MDFKDLMQPHLRDVKPYVPGKPIEELKREKSHLDEIIKLASNENPYPPVEEVKKAIIRELDQLNRYPNSGSYYLTRELAEFYSLDNNQLFVGNGSNEIIDLLVRAFINPHDHIVYPFPSFIVYPIETQLAGVKATEVPLQDYRLDLPTMKNSITNDTKMIFICNPNNPTGTYVSHAEVETFLDGLRPDIFVVFDEAYYEYVVAGDYPNILDLARTRSNLIILRTFSKIHSLAGLRIGYMIAAEEIVTCLHKVRQPFNVNRIAQIAAREALRHMDKIETRVRENREQMVYVREELEKLGFTVPPSQTNFLLVVPPPGCDDMREKITDHGIIVRGMRPFGYSDEVFRVTIGTPEENLKFVGTLKELL